VSPSTSWVSTHTGAFPCAVIAKVAFDHRRQRVAQNSPRNHQNSYRHMSRGYEASIDPRADVVNRAHHDAIAAARVASSSALDGLAR
jgi:hypothetical protein